MLPSPYFRFYGDYRHELKNLGFNLQVNKLNLNLICPPLVWILQRRCKLTSAYVSEQIEKGRDKDKLDMSSDKMSVCGWRFLSLSLLCVNFTLTLIRETASSACIIRVDFVGWPSHTNWVDPRYRARNKTPSISTVCLKRI